MKKLILILMVLYVIYPSTLLFAASSFRCGGKIISVGDTKEEILTKCGEPTKIETGKIPYVKGKRIGSLDATITPEYEEVVGDPFGGKPGYEVWHYNCGKNEFSVNITINTDSQKIANIETLVRGSGNSDCIGAEERTKRVAQRTKEREEEEKRQIQEQMENLNLQEEAYFYDKEISKGIISLSGSPKGGKVYIDGDHIADIPCTISVSAGYHKILVKKDGFNDWEKTIKIEPGRTYSFDLINSGKK